MLNYCLIPRSMVNGNVLSQNDASYIINIHNEKKEKSYRYKNYLHVIKQTLTKNIYKTFKSFESVKNLHLCHHFKTDNERTMYSLQVKLVS